MFFADRADAGRRLAVRVADVCGPDTIVLGLARGGVPVAAEVAAAHALPLDVLVVRKLGVPFQPEVAMGAIGEGGVRVLNHDVVQAIAITDDELAAAEAQERATLDDRARRYRTAAPRLDVRGHPVLVIDDGIATGATAAAACAVLRAQGATHITLAVPVAPPAWTKDLSASADTTLSLTTPPGFLAVGQFYQDFTPTTDTEVITHLTSARNTPHHT